MPENGKLQLVRFAPCLLPRETWCCTASTALRPRKENKHMQQLSAWHSLYLNARKMQSKQVIKVVHIHEHGEKCSLDGVGTGW